MLMMDEGCGKLRAVKDTCQVCSQNVGEKSLLQEATVHVKPSADASSNKLPDIRGVEQQVQSRRKRTIYRFSQVNTSSCSKLGHRGFNYFQLVRTCRQSRTQHYVCKESDLPSSFQVTCALPVEFGISSISSQRMTAVYPWCVGGCQPLSSPGILQTGQTCGCCFARSFSVFGCRQYAEHRQPACSHTTVQHWRCSSQYPNSGYISREWIWGAIWRWETKRRSWGKERFGANTVSACLFICMKRSRNTRGICHIKDSNSVSELFLNHFLSLCTFLFPVLHSMLWFLLSRNGWPQTQIFSCHSPQKERSRLCLGFLVSQGHLWLNLTILSHTLSTQSDREDWVLFEIKYL